MASARAATTIFILIVWTTTSLCKEVQIVRYRALMKNEKVEDPRGDVMQLVRS